MTGLENTSSHPIQGVMYHWIGGLGAASFYLPYRAVKKWSWETTWAVAGVFSWIILPLGVSFLLLPKFAAFYGSIPTAVLLKVALFGAMWGVGNVSYGLTMRHLGMSLGIGVAIGVTLVVGTLVPPLIHGQAASLFHTRGGLMNIAGVVVALVGVAIVSYAVHQKETQLKSCEPTEFNVLLGLALAVMSGLFSSGMSFAIDAAQPIQAAAQQVGVKPLYSALPAYVFIMGGGAVVNLAYCFVRLATVPTISLKEDLEQPRDRIAKNGLMAATGGIMWYLQFFFYAWGAANIPQHLSYVNWMLHMSGYVLFGGIVGLVLGEWAGVTRNPIRLLWVGILVIIAAANLVGLGLAS